MKKSLGKLFRKCIISLILSLIIIVPLMTPCTVLADEGQPETVRVGFFAFDGYHEIDENGNKSGYGYDFLTLMRRYSDVNYEYIGYDKSWSDMQQMLLDGDIDMVTSAHKNEEREKVFDFSLPIGTNTINLNVRTDEKRYSAGDYDTYDGMILGLIEGSSTNDKVENFASENGFSFNAKYYSDADALEEALHNGEVDAVATSSLRKIEDETILEEFNTEYFYAIVRKGDDELLDKINYGIKQMNCNEGDWKNSLYYDNYLSHKHTGLHLTDEEKAFISKYSSGNDKLVIATDTDWVPFSWKENDEYTGIIVDIIDFCMRKCGMDYVIYESDKEINNADVLEDENVDLYVGYSMSDETAEENGYVISDPVLNCGSAYLVLKETEDIKTIAICDSTPYLNSRLQTDDSIILISYKDTQAARKAVLNKEVDAAYLYDYDAEYTANHDLSGRLAYELISGGDVKIKAAIRSNDERTLLGIWMKCMNSMTEAEKTSIVSKYISHTATSMTVKDYAILHPFIFFGGILLIIAIIVAAVFIWIKNLEERKHGAALSEKVDEITALNDQLQENQARLEESAAEQEAQIEEITALNTQLEENQIRLEESTSEQESQIEEITALNVKLAQDSELMEKLNNALQENLDIIANAGHGIWRICMKADGHHTMEADKTLQEIFGITDMKFSPEELYKYYHERLLEDVSDIEENDYSNMSGGKLQTRILKWNHPTKGIIILSAGGTSYGQDERGMIISGYCGDVTDEEHRLESLNQQLEEALVQAKVASKSKSDFLFSMSHDIRTPMNAIIGYANLMKIHQDDKERCADYLNKIISSSDFLLDLINNVLEMARIESGKMVLDETTWNTIAFNDSLFAVFSEGMNQKNIAYSRTIDITNEYVFCDSVKVREIFLNILSNALKYTPAGGSVNMELKEIPSDRDGYALMQTTISDTGIGMSKDYIPHIFEEFTREKTVTENKIQGTGLGMPIVKKLVDLMGGSISVESELGKGTTFVVKLYHRISSETDIEKDVVSFDEIIDFAGKRILLAEDNDYNAEIAIELIEDTGASVERAEDGIVCFDMLNKSEKGYYDLILMDIQMPNMNGYEATRKIRMMQDLAKANIPIIAMTANAFEEDKQEALRAGMNGHIAKPVKVAELMKVLAGIIG